MGGGGRGLRRTGPPAPGGVPRDRRGRPHDPQRGVPDQGHGRQDRPRRADRSPQLPLRGDDRLRRPLMPGAKRLLTELAAHDVPTALVSASHRRIIDRVLRTLGPEHFTLTVAGDEMERTKPHPDPYLLAAARLGAAPERCAVVEDTMTGVTAAEAAGCRVVAVPSVGAIPPAPGRTVVRSLEEVDLRFLRSLVAS
ncbi:HAD family hydrolase [Streptomyces sp. CA-181903]|uniref:HAD family hydrolase n=1 Tax=Streptomyces sp. CA-181903 TaxID=3240055 RepID=UPI003D8D1F43